MSLVNQGIGAYRLSHKLNESESSEVYLAGHTRRSKEGIIQLARLRGKLNKRESVSRLKKRVETIRGLNDPHIVPILKYGINESGNKTYLYVRTISIEGGTLEEWLRQREKTVPLSQQDVHDIVQQANEAVEHLHRLGIAGLDIRLSSFVVESTDNPNRPRVLLNDFLPGVLSAERLRKDEAGRREAISGDQAALREMESRLNVYVEEGEQVSPRPSPRSGEGAEGTAGDHKGPPILILPPSPLREDTIESALREMRERLAMVEEEMQQVQRKLREQEEENERLIRELQKQQEEHRKGLAIAKAENERLIRELREQKEGDATLLTEAPIAAASTRGAELDGAVANAVTPASSTSRRTGRWNWALGGLLLLALLLTGTVFLLAGLLFFGKPAWAFGSSSAKVTITQAAYQLTQSYIFAGVTRSISQAKTQSITVPATNRVLIPGRHAIGILTFHNTQSLCNPAIVIPAGTLFKDSHGIQVVTDQAATIGVSCNVTVPAHAAKIGTAGNIRAHDMRQTYRSTIIVDNPAAFKGGQSGRRFTTVRQSDIANAASSLTARLKQGTLDALRLQLLTNEQFASSPVCKSHVTTDHQVNDITTSLHVTVTETCSVEYFDSQEILIRSETMLNNRAQALFGPNYALTGNINSEITHVAKDVQQGTLITVAASGLWTYQFSSGHVDQLAKLITGKDKQDAQAILSNQSGVQSVSISVSNNDTTMPGYASSINFAYVNRLVAVGEG